MAKSLSRELRGVLFFLVLVTGVGVQMYLAGPSGAQAPAARQAQIPRTADGKPNLQGIWQVRNRAASSIEPQLARYRMPPSLGVVDGGAIPYQEWALKKREENYAKRYELDPLGKCFMPGVPRIMYLDHPFQIFQTPTHVAMTFEWSLAHRLIYTNGSK